MNYEPELPCPEPDGNREVLDGNEYEYAHDIMINLGGQCPWCGAEQ